MADRITNGPADRPAKPQRSPAGPDTIRGAAGRRVADRITTGSWKPTGAHPSLSGSTPTTIRAALRARAADRILNGRKPKADSAPDPAAEQPGPKDAAGPPGTDLAVPPDAASTREAGAAPETGDGGKTPGARTPKRRIRRVRRRSRPRRGRARRDRRTSRSRRAENRRAKRRTRRDQRADRARQRAERANARRAERARQREDKGPRDGWGDPTHEDPRKGGSWWRFRRKYGWDREPNDIWPEPEPDFGPPPGWAWTEGETITVERVDGGPRKPAPPAALGRGQAALPRAPHRTAHARPGTTEPPTPPPPSPAGGQSVAIPLPRAAHGTQFADAELTIYDVIEADADMGEEITQGAAEAKQAATDCEELAEQLETLHTKILALKVPGVLERMVVLLIEKTAKVKARAEAVAEKIPAAAEAITTAGDNAAARHKPLADAVRDAGHTAPAERDYHNE
ncbi:hypothetical protein ABZW03_33600 [Kitasatospora sp. NPDC004799]|uniref:hypothetical protein n=1 Tax=Kitasatospora sp. NPDC004799 TaxID=3154460 RepID=UPI0033B62DEF